MALAIIADVVVVIALVLTAGLFNSRKLFLAPEARNFVVVLTLSFIVSVLLEWLPRAQHRWNYSERMPTLTVFGVAVGLLPILQITFLPALSLFLSVRLRRRGAGSSAKRE